jgi:hypothetical protein
MIKRQKNKIAPKNVKVSPKITTDFAVQVKLSLNALLLIVLLIMYDVTLFLELYDFSISDKLLFFIGDIFAWINPIILLLSSSDVRGLFGLSF